MTTEKIPSWIERLLMPKLSEISGEIKAVNTRIDALESNMSTRIDALESNMSTRIEALESNMSTRIEALESKMDIKIDSLDERMNTRINSLDEKIVSLRTEMKSDFKGLDYRFETIDIHFDSLEKRIPVIEEITALKIKIAELEKKMAIIQ